MPTARLDHRHLRDWAIEQIGDRRLAWFGTRGTDALPLLAFPQFSGLFSLIAPLDGLPLGLHQVVLEDLSGTRVDLDAYTIDRDKSPSARELYLTMAEWLSRPTVLATYRPCDFLAAVCYPRRDRVTFLGLFHAAQSAFDHKSWVETSLAERGVKILPWRYYAYHEVDSILADFSDHERFVLRANMSDGGRGVRLVERAAALDMLPPHEDHFLAAAPYIHPSIPLNAGGCVFPNGVVSIHGPSVQIIGAPECTDNPFGYCGNDFASIGDVLGDGEIAQLGKMVEAVGRWLHEQRYIGAFGIDALAHRGEIYLTEVNPRFQGSSAPSAVIDATLDRPDLYLCHIAAHLGYAPQEHVEPLMDLIRAQQLPEAWLSHVVCHNNSSSPTCSTGPLESGLGSVLSAPRAGVLAESGSTLFRIQLHDRALTSGGDLSPEIAAEVSSLAARFTASEG